jgi:hypothetical protein
MTIENHGKIGLGGWEAGRLGSVLDDVERLSLIWHKS